MEIYASCGIMRSFLPFFCFFFILILFRKANKKERIRDTNIIITIEVIRDIRLGCGLIAYGLRVPI